MISISRTHLMMDRAEGGEQVYNSSVLMWRQEMETEESPDTLKLTMYVVHL